jgi:hypothetical protein
VVVGIAGRSLLDNGYQLLTKLHLRCAAVTIEGDDDSGYRVVVGEGTLLEPVGTEVGESAGWYQCDGLAVGTALRWGYHIDGIGLHCDEPTLAVEGS